MTRPMLVHLLGNDHLIDDRASAIRADVSRVAIRRFPEGDPKSGLTARSIVNDTVNGKCPSPSDPGLEPTLAFVA